MPDTKPVSQKAAVPSATPSPSRISATRAAIAQQAQQKAEMIHQRLTEVEARVKDKANAFLTQAKSKQVHALAQSSPNLTKRLPALTAALQEVATTSQANQHIRSQALSAVRTKLQSFALGKTR